MPAAEEASRCGRERGSRGAGTQEERERGKNKGSPAWHFLSERPREEESSKGKRSRGQNSCGTFPRSRQSEISSSITYSFVTTLNCTSMALHCSLRRLLSVRRTQGRTLMIIEAAGRVSLPFVSTRTPEAWPWQLARWIPLRRLSNWTVEPANPLRPQSILPA